MGGKELIGDGRWFIPRDGDYPGDIAVVRWLGHAGEGKCRVMLCEDAYLANDRLVKAGSKRTIDTDDYHEFDDDDYE